MSATMPDSFGNVRVVDIEDTSSTTISSTSSNKSKKKASSKDTGAVCVAKDAVSEGRGSDFKVRSAGFLTSGKKAPSGAALLALASVDVVAAPGGIAHATAWKQATLQNFAERQFLIINFRCPDMSFVLCFVFPTSPDHAHQPHQAQEQQAQQSAAMALLKQFCSTETSDEWRRARLKLIPRVVEGPLLLRCMTPTAPALVAKHLASEFHVTPHVCEVVLDINSSLMARKVWGAAAGAAASTVVDLAFVIQGNHAHELPEQVCAVARVCRLDLSARLAHTAHPREQPLVDVLAAAQ